MPDQKRKEFQRLVDKYLNGTATPGEQEALDRYYLLFRDEPEYTSQLNEDQWAGLEARMESGLFGRIHPQAKAKSLWPRIAAAASIIVILSAGGYFLLHKAQPNQQVARQQVNPIKPGGNVATLTLANGKRIVLNTALNGTLVSQAGVQVKKTADGQLVYQATGNGSDQIEYNTVETPKGGQYRVELADGTVAWLNAASSLRYPNRFAGRDRIVELTGEGYFEVAKDKNHPFIVKSRGQSVEVLGTHFNINAYNDEASVKSTLLEGSVKVTGNGKSEMLRPGQQSAFAGGSLKVTEGNPEEAVAWKNGYFRFNDENIESIMRKVSRWYDVEVVYQGAKTDEGFNGAITRFSNIEDVLKIMERSKAVQFKIEGRRIIVKP